MRFPKLPRWYTNPRTQSVVWILGSMLWVLSSALEMARGRLIAGILDAFAAVVCGVLAWGVYHYNIGKGHRDIEERERRYIEEMKNRFSKFS